jgi:D-alanyl-lipoteichoic acid acyltransferase DltB (MBOAT superfamily)
MSVFHIGILAFAALVIGRLGKSRELALLGASIFFVYWLQPAQQIISFAYWLPTATLALIVFCWLLVSAPEARGWRQNRLTVLVIAGVMLLIDLNQFFGFEKIYMVTTPRLWIVALMLGSFMALFFLQTKISRTLFLFTAAFIGIILLFVFLKTPFLVNTFFEWMYSLRGQRPENTNTIISWLGFSYIAFRLMHTLRDRQSDRLPALTLAEYMNYVIFFPSLAAGPIDRAERFVRELRSPVPLAGQDWVEAGKRLFIGLFKKFVLADALALIALNDALAGQVKSPAWMWLFLYAYSLRIFFDFSGYTDIAIGLARILGFRLPENFASPYLKPNLTQFWNSWHMTLTQWFRAYFFNPITRLLRIQKFPVPLIIFITQVSTMVVIGLWHGVTWGFFLWGLWHGLGLFIQNRWSEFAQSRMKTPLPARRQLLLNAIGIFLTFNFVSLGWLFFTLSTPALALQVLGKLFGVGI